jgi:hypothetical protein
MVIRVVTKKSEPSRFTAYGKGVAIVLACISFMAVSGTAGPENNKMVREARKAMDRADPFMGDWQGNWTLDDGYTSGPLVAQVIALGKGEYRANFHGEFDYAWPPLFALSGRLEGAKAQFNGRAEFEGNALDIQSAIKDGKFTGKFKGRGADGFDVAGTFSMEKVIRLSPTLGAKPPAGAIVLFDGKDFDEWKPIRAKPEVDSVQWRLLEGGSMEVKPRTSSIITKKKFTNVKLHVEFRTPFMPNARGQGRGNSGVYLQGRYEVQVLDSYGLQGLDNECGGIYRVGRPMVNMCAPPTQWQTYDITFQARGVNENGEEIGPVMTVLHNGVMIHDKVSVSKPTTAAPDSTRTGPGGIYLQDHGNPVQYRNIWLVELPDATP